MTSSAKSIKQNSSLARMDPFRSTAGKLQFKNGKFPFVIKAVMITVKIRVGGSSLYTLFVYVCLFEILFLEMYYET